MLGKRDALSIDQQAQEITRRRDIEMETAGHSRFVRNQQLGVEMPCAGSRHYPLTLRRDASRPIAAIPASIFSRAELLAE